jgi:hypothetical protein
MLNFIKADFAKGILAEIAGSNDTKTTILGVLAGALLAARLDWGKLLAGDSAAIGQATGACIAVAIGYYTNRPDSK